jgi:hypothetical protein
VISLMWIGSFEIRMCDASSANSGEEPLFLIELFDHDARSTIDSRVCHDIEEGAAAFEAFLSR